MVTFDDIDIDGSGTITQAEWFQLINKTALNDTALAFEEPISCTLNSSLIKDIFEDVYPVEDSRTYCEKQEDMHGSCDITWGDVTWELVSVAIVLALNFTFAFPLNKLYKKHAQSDAGRSGFQWWKLVFVGAKNREPVVYGFALLLDSMQALFSVITVCLWIKKTYDRSVHDVIKYVELLMSWAYICHYMYRFLRVDFSPLFVFSLYSVLDVVSAVPLIRAGYDGVGSTWLSFSYIRVVFVIYSFHSIEKYTSFLKQLMPRGRSGEVVYKLCELALVFLVILVIMAGTIFGLEALGKIPGMEDITLTTGMGDVSFFSMFYFICVTISTVGYGDFSPTTLLSRSFSVVSIIAGVIFFTMATNEIVDIIRLQASGLGSYKPRGSKQISRHVVLCGGAVNNWNLTILQPMIQVTAPRPLWRGCCMPPH
ncbi:hypothetical protein CYMTET_14411 [Cymbomonas tetramitiformis]|uniref:EF-hand domain-containing protein n=1 Tax=Cymbomonas tetramitiformis TaxID=36881 RepID=A0AAE0GGM3_9CHLO|nr:hypothetical protein CYMTET_14411 [Cymbomonas tetramitiformis]